MSQLMETLLDLSEIPGNRLPESSMAFSKLSMFDWLVCGRAGVGEPLAAKLREFAAQEGGREIASIFGSGRTPARMAALVNGATSHALDYDDTYFGHIGHLSVGIYPAALAAGEEVLASAAEVAAAFLLGAEAAIRTGMALGAVHYNRGFHQTATAGAFGATVAAGRLYGLTREQMRAALGLCSTRASGLKSQFGTMGKPYNAGIAAANGIECAQLARLGMTSCDDGLFGAQGFIPTHSDAPVLETVSVEHFLFDSISYKFHACCHGTHAMIEALLTAMESTGIGSGDVACFRLKTNPRWLSVCNIATPTTGLEVKFSYRWLAGMVLNGIDTGSDKAFTDSTARDPALAAFSQRVEVTGDESLTDMQAHGELDLNDGTCIPIAHDLARPVAPDELAIKLRAKAAAILGEAALPLATVLDDMATLTAADLGQLVRTGA